MKRMERGFQNKMRRQNWYRVVSEALANLGITDWQIVPATGKGHPKLIAHHEGRTLKMPVPSSESPRAGHKYLARGIQRWAEGGNWAGASR